LRSQAFNKGERDVGRKVLILFVSEFPRTFISIYKSCFINNFLRGESLVEKLRKVNFQHQISSRNPNGNRSRFLQMPCLTCAIFVLILFQVMFLSSCKKEDSSNKQQETSADPTLSDSSKILNINEQRQMGKKSSSLKPETATVTLSTLDNNSTFPIISVSFAGQPKIKSPNRLRLDVKNIPRECLLVVTLKADVDIYSSKPTPPLQCRELLGLPMVHKVEPSNGTWEISYPVIVFVKESYLSPGDERDIRGWIVGAYLVDEVLATPIQIPRNIGDLHVITTGEILKGWYLLCSEIDSKEFDKDAGFDLLIIPGSNAGAFFYVKKTGLIAEIRKEFNKDFLER